MKILNIVNTPWAIIDDLRNQIAITCANHLRGEKVDFKGAQAVHGSSEYSNSRNPGYEIINGVAVIPLQGIMLKKPDAFFEYYFGAVAATEIYTESLIHASDNDDVRGMLTLADTGGGTVDGTDKAAQIAYDLREVKPHVTLADGLLASAGIWVGTASHMTFMTDPTTITGSIGVASQLVSYAEYYKEIGIEIRDVYSGKYKRINSQNKPISDEGEAYEQGLDDYLYDIFIDVVAKHRGASVKATRENMADAKLFIGQQGIDAGLIDGISTLDALVEQLSTGKLPGDNSVTVSVGVTKTELNIDEGDKTVSEITLAFITEKHPSIATALRDEGISTVDVGSIRTEAADTERQRIQSVLDVSMAGHEDLINTLAFDGKTTGPEAAVQVIAAEKANGKANLSKIKEDSADVSGVVHSDDDEESTSADSNLSAEQKAEKEFNASDDLQKEFGKFSTYLAFKNMESEKRK